jgi:glycosyltransferase involved in cell wall biosynthesis
MPDNKPLKIAVWHHLSSGGGSRALRQHLKGLAERGHHLEVWTSSLADSDFLDVSDYVKQQHVLPLDMSIRVRRQYLDSLLALGFVPDTPVRRMLAFCAQCAEQINAGGFDVLFANSCVYFMMPYIGRFVRIPKVLYLGEPNRYLFEAYPDVFWEALPPLSENWRDRAYRARFWNDLLEVRKARVRVREELANFRSYDTVLVNSYFSKESVGRAYGGSAEVCYLGIDTDLFPHLNLPREPFVMGLGSFFYQKNIELAIEAIALLPATTRPRLVWVGDTRHPTYFNQLLELSQRLGVVFEPRQRIPQAELVRLLNTARCLLYPSKLEPFGLAPLEANACGLPVVAVREGGVRESIVDGQNGLLVNRDAAEMARALDRVLTDEALFGRLSAGAVETVRQHWTVRKAVDCLERHLLKAAGRPVSESQAVTLR